MSANNEIVVVKENPTTEDSYTVWYDGCVDNPFPSSATKLGEFTSRAEALEFAHDQLKKDPYIEYGVVEMFGPTKCSHINEDA